MRLLRAQSPTVIVCAGPSRPVLHPVVVGGFVTFLIRLEKGLRSHAVFAFECTPLFFEQVNMVQQTVERHRMTKLDGSMATSSSTDSRGDDIDREDGIMKTNGLIARWQSVLPCQHTL